MIRRRNAKSYGSLQNFLGLNYAFEVMLCKGVQISLKICLNGVTVSYSKNTQVAVKNNVRYFLQIKSKMIVDHSTIKYR